MRIPFVSKFLAQRRSKAVEYERQNYNWNARTAAGIYISPDRSLRDSTVWACHRYLTQTVAQLPVRIMKMRQDGSGSSERIPTNPIIHPTDYVLNWRVNPELGPFQFKETMIGWALLWGNGYAEIELDGAGRLLNLWPIEPWRMKVMRDPDGTLFYLVDNETRLESTQVFHIRGFGNGPVGLSVVEYAAQTIGWAQATELFGGTYFGEGMHFEGIVKLNGKSNTTSLTRMRTELENKHKGVGRSNKWAFLDNGADVVKMTATPNDAQFVETMQFQVEQICRWFGVPPQKVQHLLRATFSNVEQLSIDVVGDAIAPWAVRFEEEGTYKLFGQNRNNLFLKMDLKGLLRGDFQGRQTGLQIMRRNGVINANNWADIEDMPRVGPEGDKYVIEGNMTTLDQVGQKPPGGPSSVVPTSEVPTSPDPNQTKEDPSIPSPGAVRLFQMVKEKEKIVERVE